LILIDTGAIYALVDTSDANHGQAVDSFEKLATQHTFVVTLPIVTEACWMLEERLGAGPARIFWEDVVHGVFALYQLDIVDLARALEIERKYDDVALGFTVACSLACTERLHIEEVFTFDRRDFVIYRTPQGGALRLLP